MFTFLVSTECRAKAVAAFFDQKTDINCNNCDSCVNDPAEPLNIVQQLIIIKGVLDYGKDLLSLPLTTIARVITGQVKTTDKKRDF